MEMKEGTGKRERRELLWTVKLSSYILVYKYIFTTVKQHKPHKQPNSPPVLISLLLSFFLSPSSSFILLATPLFYSSTLYQSKSMQGYKPMTEKYQSIMKNMTTQRWIRQPILHSMAIIMDPFKTPMQIGTLNVCLPDLYLAYASSCS